MFVNSAFGPPPPVDVTRVYVTEGSKVRAENPYRTDLQSRYRDRTDFQVYISNVSNLNIFKELGSLKISRRNPCSPFFSVSYSINRHKIL